MAPKFVGLQGKEVFNGDQVVPRWKHQFPFEHRSLVKLGQESTWWGDHLGTPVAVDKPSWAKQMGGKSLSRLTGSVKVLTAFQAACW